MSDMLPTRVLKSDVDLLAPFLTELSLFSRSLSLGSVPVLFKAAYITSQLKKPDADPADVKQYRPISNLSVLSNLFERLVARQLLVYLTTFRLLPEKQSAYRAYHSTETAVLKVLSDILLAVDTGDLAALTLLDLSAAFDRSADVDTRCKDRVELLCSVAANPERQTVCAKTNFANTGRVTRTVHIGRTSGHSTRQSAVGTERRCATRPRHQTEIVSGAHPAPL